MATFSYEVIAPDGKNKKGTIDAADKKSAMAQLKTDGNTVLVLNEASALSKDINISIGGKVKPRDLSVFCRQLASIMKAGVSIVEALGMLGEQTGNKNLKQAIYNVQDSVQKGDTLSDSMRKEKDIFPSILINMVEAGEMSGSLETSVDRMATHFEKDAKIKGMVKKAMIYPMVLLVVAIGVLVIMCIFVVPNFVDVFASMGTELPIMTKIVVWMSDFMVAYWYLVLAAVVILIVGYKVFSSSEIGERIIATITLKIPVIGVLVRKTACARFARTLSTLLSSGMPLVDSVSITARAIDNVLFEEELQTAVVQIQKGMNLSTVLKKNKMFPPMILHMLAIGEETGNMEEMLENAANYYDEEVESSTAQVMALMEPAIIIVMAGMVGLIIAAIYGPVLTMTTGIS